MLILAQIRPSLFVVVVVVAVVVVLIVVVVVVVLLKFPGEFVENML